MRWALLTASVAAFFLVSAAAANAAIDSKVIIEGSGDGTVTGEAPLAGNPPVNCHKPSQGGDVCETESVKPEGSSFKGVALLQEAAAGSKFVEWKVVKGFAPEECSPTRCAVINTGAGIEVKAIFEKTAEPNVHILIEGSGSGSVVANPGSPLKGTPPVNCAWNGETEEKTGACDVVASKSESFEGVNVIHEAAPGSEFAGWEVVEGFGVNCEAMAEFCAAIFPPITIKATFTKEAPPAEPNVKLNIESGEGTVVSNPAGLSCSGLGPKSCEAALEEGKVTLTASPAPGYMFQSWKKCDSGGVNGRQCTITAGSSLKEIGAKFVKTWNLDVSKAGSGIGKFQSAPGGILCLYNCGSAEAAFKEGTVTIKQAPAKHNHFVQWLGDCTGSAETCTVNMNEDHSVEAEFAPDTQYTLSISKEGGGQASIKSSPSGLLCGYTCSSQTASFYSGETVSIAVTLNKGTSSVEWTTGAGTCTGNALTCTVPMSSAKSLVAKLS